MAKVFCPLAICLPLPETFEFVSHIARNEDDSITTLKERTYNWRPRQATAGHWTSDQQSMRRERLSLWMILPRSVVIGTTMLIVARTAWDGAVHQPIQVLLPIASRDAGYLDR